MSNTQQQEPGTMASLITLEGSLRVICLLLAKSFTVMLNCQM